MTLTQGVLTLFLLFALSRVLLRFKGGSLSLFGFLFWSVLFSIAVAIVLLPDLTSSIAKVVGIGRGVDAVVYTSIVLLFYLVFRIYVYLQDIRQEITTLVQKLALKDKSRHERKFTKN